MTMPYGYTKHVELSFEVCVEKTKNELKEEGFGILTEIDVQTTLKKKLNVDYDKYFILGACHPQSAYKALTAVKEIGLLLPCNVILYEDKGNVFVSAIKPSIAMKELHVDAIKTLACEIEEKLKRVVDNL
jgi:uncharacterized protein (DUF302 family)